MFVIISYFSSTLHSSDFLGSYSWRLPSPFHSTHARAHTHLPIFPHHHLHPFIKTPTPTQINHDVQAGNLILDLDDCVSAYAMASIIESKRLAMTASDAIDELSIFRAKRKIMPTPLKMLGKVTQKGFAELVAKREAELASQDVSVHTFLELCQVAYSAYTHFCSQCWIAPRDNMRFTYLVCTFLPCLVLSRLLSSQAKAPYFGAQLITGKQEENAGYPSHMLIGVTLSGLHLMDWCVRARFIACFVLNI